MHRVAEFRLAVSLLLASTQALSNVLLDAPVAQGRYRYFYYLNGERIERHACPLDVISATTSVCNLAASHHVPAARVIQIAVARSTEALQKQEALTSAYVAEIAAIGVKIDGILNNAPSRPDLSARIAAASMQLQAAQSDERELRVKQLDLLRQIDALEARLIREPSVDLATQLLVLKPLKLALDAKVEVAVEAVINADRAYAEARSVDVEGNQLEILRQLRNRHYESYVASKDSVALLREKLLQTLVFFRDFVFDSSFTYDFKNSDVDSGRVQFSDILSLYNDFDEVLVAGVDTFPLMTSELSSSPLSARSGHFMTSLRSKLYIWGGAWTRCSVQ